MKSLGRGIWLILTLDCEGSARLTSEGFDRKLGIFERIAIRCHNAFCKKSRKLAKQLKLLNKVLSRKSKSDLAQAPSLSEKTKQRIQKMIDETLDS